MAKINVAKPFKLTLDDHTTREFPAGVHDVEPAIADHWFVRGHLTDPKEEAHILASEDALPFQDSPASFDSPEPVEDAQPPTKKSAGRATSAK